MYLIALESVEKTDADDGRRDARVMRESREREALHLDIDDPRFTDLAQIIHFLVLSEIAECTVQTSLTLVKVVGAHRLAYHRVVRILRMREGLQISHQLAIELRGSADQLSENRLQSTRKSFSYFYTIAIALMSVSENNPGKHPPSFLQYLSNKLNRSI